MALIPCPRCGRPVSDKARQCPHCGALFPLPGNMPTDQSRKDRPKNKSALWVILSIAACILIAAGAYFFFINDGSSVNDHTNSSKSMSSLYSDSIPAADEKSSTAILNEAQFEADAQKSATQARNEATEWDDFTTPDLVLLDLHGHVKSVDYADDGFYFNKYLFLLSEDKYNLDQKGRITNLNCVRNNKNQIAKIYDPDGSSELELSWQGNFPEIINYNGINEGGDARLYYYHDQLKYFATNCIGGSGGFVTRERIVISPIKFDNRGNWTKAEIIIEGSSTAASTQKTNEKETIERTITYYPKSIDRQNSKPTKSSRVDTLYR